MLERRKSMQILQHLKNPAKWVFTKFIGQIGFDTAENEPSKLLDE